MLVTSSTEHYKVVLLIASIYYDSLRSFVQVLLVVKRKNGGKHEATVLGMIHGIY